MPELERPDGATLHWEERGEGPTIMLVLQFFGLPDVFEDLISDLSSDHRVVLYDVRGVGRSACKGPFSQETDAEDLIALLEEVAGAGLLLAFADGMNRAVRAAVRRPDLAGTVLSPAGNPLARQAGKGTDAMVGSDSVVEALTGMVATDYRGALRTLFTVANPQMAEEQIRERVQLTVDNCPQDVAAERMKLWVEDDLADEARRLGGRLWLLEHGQNPWFPAEVARRTRKLLPECHIEEVEDGPLSRPDITAGYVRRILQSTPALTSERGD